MEERLRAALPPGARLQRPPNPALGDYAIFVGPERAESVAQTVRDALGAFVASVNATDKGFINILLSRKTISFFVKEAEAKGDEWGRGSEERGKRILIEYSNPNAFKEMHVGHLVGTVMGEAVARLLENAGATIARDTFGGDVGPNVAKALWGLKRRGVTEPANASEIGDAYTEGARAYESDPAAKTEIDALNQALYASADTELMTLWKRGREISMEEFRRIWQELGTRFDFEFFDSDTAETGLRVVHDGLARGIFEKSEGAIIYRGEGKGVDTAVFVTSANTPTYAAKDMGLAFLKEERWPSDEVIIVTGNEQTGHFKTVLSALAELAPLVAAKMKHLPTGFLRLQSGKMSSREGNVITAATLMQNIMEKAAKKNPDPLVAQAVGIGAIKFMILRQAPGSDILFDEEKSLSLDGDSGPYLQYALVRARSVLAQAREQGSAEAPEQPYDIERTLVHYPEVAARAARERAPNLLVTYLLELAAEWNSFYARERIIGGEYESYKLLVARAFACTMHNGLTLLGISIPERM